MDAAFIELTARRVGDAPGDETGQEWGNANQHDAKQDQNIDDDEGNFRFQVVFS
jgi:hypothetical protein